jgi:hypothetical protein
MAKTKKPVKLVKKRVARKPVAKKSPPPETTLVIRTCDVNLRGHGGFQWPRSGPVECPDWDPKPACGNGIHGLAWGNGDWSNTSRDADAVWMVVGVKTADLVWIGKDKVKFARGTVVLCGTLAEATARCLCGPEAMAETMRSATEWERAHRGTYSKAASSGAYSKAASSGAYSTAASSGDSSKAASSGAYSTAASSGYSSTAASSGDSSKAASLGDSSKAASSGASGIAASIGNNGSAKAGPNGIVIVTYWVAAEKRYRACVGNVGEDGILADTWYVVRGGKLVVA